MSVNQHIHGFIGRQASRDPHAVALVFEGAMLTYGELDARAEHLASRLRAHRVGAGVLVAVSLERSFELVIALLGILKSGGAYVPLDPSYPKDRLQFMLEDSGAPILITADGESRTLTPPKGTRVIAVNPSAAQDAGWDGSPPPSIRPDHVAYVIYTSGSTGRPKGTMNTHGAILNRLVWMQEAFKLDPTDAVLQKTPFSFDVSVWEFFWPLMFGARLVIAAPDGHRDSAYLARLIRDEKITTAHFVPSMLEAFLEEPACRTCDSLRRVICSGEALTYPLAERFFEKMSAELHNLYGPTEAAVDVTWWPCARHAHGKSLPIGRPISNTTAYVLDGDLSPVPVGKAGELYLGGVQLARGYLRRPSLTAERFLPCNDARAGRGARMYRTGDLAQWRADGALEYLGRVDHQVKLHGFRIELGEIESALVACAGVREAVVSVHERAGGKHLVAYLVATHAVAPAESELRAALEKTLPPHMVPTAFVFLAAFPLTPSGKVDRKALPDPSPTSEGSQRAPASETERALVQIFCDALKIDGIDVDVDFFDLGGDSISALRMLAMVNRQFGAEIPLHELFQMDPASAASLATKVANVSAQEHRNAPPTLRHVAHRDLRVPLSPNQEHIWHWQKKHPDSASRTFVVAWRLYGRIDTRAFGAAVDELFRRHAVLRTKLEIVDATPVQVVTPVPTPVMELLDWSETPMDARARRIEDSIARDGVRPVDLEGAILTHVRLVRFADDDHALIFHSHHIVMDLPQVYLLVAQLLELYDAIAHGRSLPAFAPPVDYADYSVWRDQTMRGADVGRQRAFWERSMRDVAPVTLPFDKAAPSVRTDGSHTAGVDLDDAVLANVTALAKAESVTRFVVASAVFAVFLADICRQDDLFFLTLTAQDGAGSPELADVIGCFMDFVPMRVAVSPSLTFRQLLHRVRDATRAAVANRDVPAAMVVGDPTVFDSPFARALLNVFEGMPAVPRRTGGVSIEYAGRFARPRVADIAWSFYAHAHRANIALSSDVFDEATAVRLAQRAAALLALLVASPDAPISALSAR